VHIKVQKDYPHLVAGTSVARKMGFPDVILPGLYNFIRSLLLHVYCLHWCFSTMLVSHRLFMH